MTFNDYDYTRDSIIKQLTLMELHGKDGSAVDAGCQCINTKHTYMLEGLAEEMAGFAKSEAERKYYLNLSAQMRKIRQDIDAENWSHSHIDLGCSQKMAKCLESNSSEECQKKVKCLG